MSNSIAHAPISLKNALVASIDQELTETKRASDKPENMIRDGECQNSFESFCNDLLMREEILFTQVKDYGFESLEAFAFSQFNHNTSYELLDLQNQCQQLIKQKKDIKKTVYIEEASRIENLDTIEEILIQNKDSGIYQRSGKLVCILHDDSFPQKQNYNNFKKITLNRKSIAPIIYEFDTRSLAIWLDRSCIFMKLDLRSTKKLKKINCSDSFAQSFMAKLQWKLPVLTGIIKTPSLRKDGTILDTAGYDEISGIFFAPGDCKFEKVPENPTKNDAINALERINNIIDGFPFVDNVSKSTAIAMLLTAITRKAFPTAPGFGITAPKPGTGKSKLADVVAIIATGEVNNAISQAIDEQEEKKRMFPILLQDPTVVCFDNVEKRFGNDALCIMLTQQEYQERVLGSSTMRTVSTCVTLMVTGNNLKFAGDMTSRMLLIKLDAKTEHPEERNNFAIKDLLTHVKTNRPSIVKDLLTMVRAYEVAERPQQLMPQFGRFEEWSNLIRGTLLWIGMEDPYKSRQEIQKEDHTRNALIQFFSAWYEIFQDNRVTVKEIVNAADLGQSRNVENFFTHELLRDAILDLIGNTKNDDINIRALAGKLSANKENIAGGLKLIRLDGPKNTSLWKIEKV